MARRRSTEAPSPTQSLYRHHLRIGWCGLFIFLALGLVLETLHGLKASFYLDEGNEMRRLMWTLAHAHGTLFSLIHIAFAASLGAVRPEAEKTLQFVSACLLGALIAMPLGFFLGGVWLYKGDPGMGVFIVPVGGLMMLLGVGTCAWLLYRS